jgi:hypothetical protein
MTACYLFKYSTEKIDFLLYNFIFITEPYYYTDVQNSPWRSFYINVTD